MNEMTLAKLRQLAPRLRKLQGDWPAVETWRRGFEGIINTERAPNKLGQIVRSAGLHWAPDHPPPAWLGHEAALQVGEVRAVGRDGSARIALPPPGVDVLVDETVAWMRDRLARGRPVYLSMETTDHVRAGAEVLSAKLLGVAILAGDAPGGVPGARVTRLFDEAGRQIRAVSPDVARLVAEAQREADEFTARRWRAGHAAHGWRV